MSQVVTIELNVEDAQAVRAWKRSSDSIEHFVGVAGKIGKTNRSNTDSVGQFFRTQGAGLASAAIGFAGVGSAVAGIATAAALVRAEFDNLLEKQRAAAETTLPFEARLATAVRNASGIFTATEVRQQSLQLAADAQISPAKAAGLVGSAITSTGVTNAEEAQLALRAARASALFAPDLDEQGLESLGGVSASLAKRFDASPEAAIGFIQQVGVQSNVRDLAPLVSNVAPNLANLTEYGFRPEEAGALISTLTQRLGDETGEVSTTAAVNFADSLRERFSGQFQQADGQFDPIAAIEYLQEDQSRMRKFFDGGEFFGQTFGKASIGKGKAQIPLEQLLTSGSQTDQQFLGSLDSIGTLSDGEGTYRRTLDAINSVTPLSQVDRALTSTREAIQVDDQSAIGRRALDELEHIQQSIGSSRIRQRITGLQAELESGLGTNPVDALHATREALFAESQDLADGEDRVVVSDTGSAFGRKRARRVHVDSTPAQLADAEKLNRLIEVLGKVASQLENQDSGARVVEVRVAQRKVNADVRQPPAQRPSTALSSSP